jgi:hypothetical protein
LRSLWPFFVVVLQAFAFFVVVPQGSAVVLVVAVSPSLSSATSSKPQNKMRRSITSLVLLLITIPLGLAVRFLPLHLPWFLYKYLGSALWAIALYWLLAALLPKPHPRALAALAIIIATLLELSRLVPIAPIDAFRLTFAGQILLGRFFSIKNIATYVFAIAIAATLDQAFIARR